MFYFKHARKIFFPFVSKPYQYADLPKVFSAQMIKHETLHAAEMQISLGSVNAIVKTPSTNRFPALLNVNTSLVINSYVITRVFLFTISRETNEKKNRHLVSRPASKCKFCDKFNLMPQSISG